MIDLPLENLRLRTILALVRLVVTVIGCGTQERSFGFLQNLYLYIHTTDIRVFLLLHTAGTPVESLSETASSPTVLVTGPRGDCSQSYVLVEGQSTPTPSLLCALDKAFKLHYLFNVAYNPKSEHLWQLLQKVVYNIQDNTTTFSSVYDFQAFMKDKQRTAANL